MKNDYEKYIKEVIEIKEKTCEDFKKSGFKNYNDFIKEDIKNIKIIYRKKKDRAA